MSSNRVVLHIGLEKTGTTTLQRFLAANQCALKQADVLYPQATAPHAVLPLCVQEVRGDALQRRNGISGRSDVRAFRQRVEQAMQREFSEAGCSTMVLSSELCSSRLRTDEELCELRDILSEYAAAPTIVVYIRRQDEYLVSLHSTAVQSGSVAPLDFPATAREIGRYDYWEILSRWARVFGRENIICRRFERHRLIGQDIVTDFLTTVGLASLISLPRPADKNESVDANCVEFLRQFNNHIAALHDPERSRRELLGALSRYSSGPWLTLPEPQLAAFMARFELSNRKVAAEYFPKESGNLFDHSKDTRPKTVSAEITAARAIEIAAQIWKRDQETITRLLRRLGGHS